MCVHVCVWVCVCDNDLWLWRLAIYSMGIMRTLPGISYLHGTKLYWLILFLSHSMSAYLARARAVVWTGRRAPLAYLFIIVCAMFDLCSQLIACVYTMNISDNCWLTDGESTIVCKAFSRNTPAYRIAIALILISAPNTQRVRFNWLTDHKPTLQSFIVYQLRLIRARTAPHARPSKLPLREGRLAWVGVRAWHLT